MEGHILGQGHRQVKAEAQVAVALGEAVDLLLRLAAGFGQQHLAGFDNGGVQGGEAVEGIGLPEDGHDLLHLLLRAGEQLHEAGEGAGLDFTHGGFSFIW